MSPRVSIRFGVRERTHDNVALRQLSTSHHTSEDTLVLRNNYITLTLLSQLVTYSGVLNFVPASMYSTAQEGSRNLTWRCERV